jgi:glycosyltransferase involved in cell wall biosynthesis
MKIFVVIPAYNEALRIGEVLKAMPKHVKGHLVRTVVIDDGSSDATKAAATVIPGVTVLRHRTNLGKGAAAKTGCDAAYRLGADIIVLMDGDGQHRPEEIERMVLPMLHSRRKEDAHVALVVGTRKLNADMPFMMRFGNGVMNNIARMTFGITTRDTQSGFRAIRRDMYPKIRWAATNYAMEMEMLILAYAQRLEVREVEIQTIYHDNYKGTTALDGLRIVKTLIKWKVLWFREFNSLESFSL